MNPRLQDPSSRVDLLQCPDCRVPTQWNGALHCPQCGRRFNDEATGTVSMLPKALAGAELEAQRFWGDIFEQLYGRTEESWTRETLLEHLELLEDLFRWREHLATKEMSLAELAGKHVLEVGSGAGGHSVLFRKHGANVTAVDITPERVASTSRKLVLLADTQPGSGMALQADATELPFRDGSFDIVFSNGVLHHTEDPDMGVQEVYRVLKPGGRAVIMLYSKTSANYWFHIIPKGIVSGQIFRQSPAKWIGAVTEGTAHSRRNSSARTNVYSKAETLRLFRQFKEVHLRKNSFFISQVLPIPQSWRDRALAMLGKAPHPGGILVYGKPVVPETGFERRLGRTVGFCWNIRARKPPS